MVESSIEYIYPVILKALFIDDLEVKFTKEFWLLYLLLVEIFRNSKIYKVLIICINFYLVFDSVKIKFLFFKWFDDNY